MASGGSHRPDLELTRTGDVRAMRIAISGSHATGKSTLLVELTRFFPDAVAVEEPYYLLAEQGHVFADPPTPEDFEILFEHSVATFATHSGGSVIFDRSPADYLAYLVALPSGTAMPEHVRATAAALATLDLVVYVPIERPDRIDSPESARLRRRVDDVLRDMLVNQTWGFDVPVVEVHGTPRERAGQVAAFRLAR